MVKPLTRQSDYRLAPVAVRAAQRTASLKSRHSAFYGAPLEFLLDETKVARLILTGITPDSCVMFTGHDAYFRGYRLWIPRDCVASECSTDFQAWLRHMTRVLKASTLDSHATLRQAFRSEAS